MKTGSAQLERLRVAAALVLVAFTIQGCENSLKPGSDHHVEIDYKCMHWQDSLCREWKAKGVVTTRKNLLCFPGDAMVITRDGPKRMSSIRMGDELMGLNHASGMTEFSAIRAWLHRETTTVAQMLRIRTELGDVVVSPEHSMAVGGGREFTFASALVAGDTLITPEGTATVREVSLEDAQGLFAPLTWTSNFFVGYGEEVHANARFLAHSFAVVPHPQWFETPFHALLSIAEFFSPAIHGFDEKNDEVYLHPVCRRLMRTFGIQFVEGALQTTIVDLTLVPGSPATNNAKDVPSLRSRRLGHQANGEKEEDEELEDYLQVIIDHPAFMFSNNGVTVGNTTAAKNKDKIV